MLRRDSSILRRVITYGVWGLNIGLALCVLLRIKIPGIFATPSIFAMIVFPLLVATLYPFKRGYSRREISAKLGVLTFYLVLLLAFPHVILTGRPSRGFFSMDFYFMMVLIVGGYWIEMLSQRVFSRSIPVLLWGILVPASILLIHWFFFPEATISELKILAVILVAAAPIIYLWAWLRESVVGDKTMILRKKITLTVALMLSPFLLGSVMGLLGQGLGIPTGLTPEEVIRLLISPETQQSWMAVMLYRIGFLFLTAMVVALFVKQVGAWWGWRYALLAIVPFSAPLLLFWSLVEVGIIIAFSVLSLGNSYLIQQARTRKE